MILTIEQAESTIHGLEKQINTLEAEKLQLEVARERAEYAITEVKENADTIVARERDNAALAQEKLKNALEEFAAYKQATEATIQKLQAKLEDGAQ